MNKASEGGADGVFLINHGVPYIVLLGWTIEVSKKFPTFWVGLNLLGLSALQVFHELPAELVEYVKGIWADDAHIDEQNPNEQPYPTRVIAKVNERKYEGLYFGGVSFKYQRVIGPLDSAMATKIARNYMHVITTSGEATGKPPDVEKIKLMKLAAGSVPLAIASGVSATNISDYSTLHVDCFLVATSVSDTFHELNAGKVKELSDILRGVLVL